MSRLATCSLAAALGLVSAAHAQDGAIATRRVGVHWEDGAPRVVFSAMDLADRAVRRKLESGLPQTLAMRVYAYREGGQPVAVAARSCRVVYDLWEETFRVQVQEPSVDRVESFGSLDAVLRRCLVARRMAIGRASDYRGLRGGSIYFAVLLELNPLSPDTVHRIRRWLSGGPGAGQEAFFGSFVSLFVNRRIGAAERTLRFRSPLARVPP